MYNLSIHIYLRGLKCFAKNPTSNAVRSHQSNKRIPERWVLMFCERSFIFKKKQFTNLFCLPYTVMMTFHLPQTTWAGIINNPYPNMPVPCPMTTLFQPSCLNGSTSTWSSIKLKMPLLGGHCVHRTCLVLPLELQQREKQNKIKGTACWSLLLDLFGWWQYTAIVGFIYSTNSLIGQTMSIFTSPKGCSGGFCYYSCVGKACISCDWQQISIKAIHDWCQWLPWWKHKHLKHHNIHQEQISTRLG